MTPDRIIAAARLYGQTKRDRIEENLVIYSVVNACQSIYYSVAP